MTNPTVQILIVSGGAGASGEQLVHTTLAQFPDRHVKVSTLANIRFESQIDQAVQRARQQDAILVHTLVDGDLRAALLRQAAEQGVTTVDLMGPLLGLLSQRLGQAPVEQPGLYRKLNKAYFERVAAIEYTIAHDDGQKPENWPQAEVLLLGVSRSGKTPLCLYLSVLGWKAANLPLVPGLELPEELYQVDRRRVLGLLIEPGQLLAFRQQRQLRLGVSGPSSYTNPEKLYAEVEYARQVYRRGGFATLDVTDKPIESTADEIIRLISRLPSD